MNKRTYMKMYNRKYGVASAQPQRSATWCYCDTRNGQWDCVVLPSLRVRTGSPLYGDGDGHLVHGMFSKTNCNLCRTYLLYKSRTTHLYIIFFVEIFSSFFLFVTRILYIYLYVYIFCIWRGCWARMHVQLGAHTIRSGISMPGPSF